MVVRRAIKAKNILGGAGSIEMELSKRLKMEAKGIKGER